MHRRSITAVPDGSEIVARKHRDVLVGEGPDRVSKHPLEALGGGLQGRGLLLTGGDSLPEGTSSAAEIFPP
jgi:hypothetical protein